MHFTNTDILLYLWSQLPEKKLLKGDFDENVYIINKGTLDKDNMCYRRGVVEIDKVQLKGDILFNAGYAPEIMYDAILRVLESPTYDILTSIEGERIPQIVLNIPKNIFDNVESLKGGSRFCECASTFKGMNAAESVCFMDKLMIGRLERKSGRVMDFYNKSDFNWNQTLYAALCRAMGGSRNQEPYAALASRATYKMLQRERSSQGMLEALLLGTSGLLEGCYYDDYIHKLREDYRYLQNKYGISTMRADEWKRGGYPVGNPVIRLVQIASLARGGNLDFDTVINSKSIDDVYGIFNADVSDYWTEHYVPDRLSARCPKRIGKKMADILAINAVVPVMFAYGEYSGKYELKEYAIDLLGKIDAENNSIISSWKNNGVAVKSAYDSQALIELSGEYCQKRLCCVCTIGRKIIKT